MKKKPKKPITPKADTAAKSKKKKYKIRNWKKYNQSLVDRGRITFWVSEDAIEAWEAKKKTGKPGKPQQYSDIAIETALMLGQVFHLPLRQTEGMLASILDKLGVPVSAPDYSTLSLRSGDLSITIRVRPIRSGNLHIVVDSTGAKLHGEGEWKVRMHGWSKHRTWKKLHVGVDEATGDILLGEVTGNDETDAALLPELLDQLPEDQEVDQCSADGAYDKQGCYDALTERNVPHITIPPQQNARIRQHGNSKKCPHPRDENLRRIRKIGRKRWKAESGYHRRSLAETTMFRLKTIFGDNVRARSNRNQRTELLLRCKALNRMTTLGMPDAFVAMVT